MKFNLRKIFLLSVFLIVSAIALIYFGYLFVLPKLFASEYFSNKLKTNILNRTGIVLSYDRLELKTYPNLYAELYINKTSARFKCSEKNFFEEQNLEMRFAPFKIKPHVVEADYLYFDKPEFVRMFPKREKPPKKHRFKISQIPSVKIQKADIVIHDEQNNKTSLSIKKLFLLPNKDGFIMDADVSIISTAWKHPINILSYGNIYEKGHSILARNLKIKSEIADIIVNGKLKDRHNHYQFNVKAHNLSVYVLENTFLAIMKHIKPKEKNFIENFCNFKGLADLDLNFAPRDITGKITTKNLSANTVKFSIPILLPNVDFIFEKDKVSAAAEGTFGGEKVHTDFSTINMFDDKTRLVSGNVSAAVGSKFAKTYIPDTDIKNSIDLSVKYKVFHQTPEVEYFANIPVGSNIYYKICDLGLLDDTRRVYAKTVKIGDNMYLKTYDYSVVNGENIKNILTGDGLFVRKNNKFGLEYITGKTAGEAPVSLTGSFGRYVQGGKFSGDLKYDYPKEIITGHFKVTDTRYKDFYVKEASVIADEKTMDINANGNFDKAKFTGYINMINHFKDKITIHNIDLYLEYFTVKKNPNAGKKIEIKIPQKTKDIDWIIEHGSIRLDKIKYERLIVESVELIGSLRNKKVTFSIPGIAFAGGQVSAEGTYNISNHSSDTYFNASNINSDKAADMLLNLQDQIEGTANVRTHLITKNKLEHLDATTTFLIKQGALKKLGDREFIVKKSKDSKHVFKFKLPDIINIDKQKIKDFKADLNGSFDVHDDVIDNAKIFSQQKYLSLFTEGKYNMVTQDAEISVWGKYNKNAQKGIRILFIPLSMITKVILRPEKTRDLYTDKINQIPPIEAEPSQLEIFKVKVTGNPNVNSKMKVELKRLK